MQPPFGLGLGTTGPPCPFLGRLRIRLRHHRSLLLGILWQSILLRRRPLQLALASSLGPGTLGIHLLLEQPLALLLGLGTVDLQVQVSGSVLVALPSLVKRSGLDLRAQRGHACA